jgi:nitrate reductase NapE component
MAFNWKSLVGTVAPTIATALGGPLAGLGVRALSHALLGKNDADEAEIAAALQGATPETLLALKAADQEFAVRMKELDIDVYRIDAGDRDSARKREAVVGGAIVPTLAVAVIGGFFAMMFAVLFGYAVAESTLAGTLIGYASAKAEQVIAYYFGSSAGSKQKTEAMKGMLAK